MSATGKVGMDVSAGETFKRVARFQKGGSGVSLDCWLFATAGCARLASHFFGEIMAGSGSSSKTGIERAIPPEGTAPAPRPARASGRGDMHRGEDLGAPIARLRNYAQPHGAPLRSTFGVGQIDVGRQQKRWRIKRRGRVSNPQPPDRQSGALTN